LKNFFLLPAFCFCVFQHTSATGYDVKTSSIIDQPAIEVLGDYNGSWYVIGFEKPNHPDKPARFYILKYAAGFPMAKSSPVYPPFGEKTDYLKAAIVDKKLSIFYSRTEHLPDRPNMVDSREGYKQIPKIMRQDYDPVSLLPVGEPVVVFDELKEHFAACGIDIAQSEDKTKTSILIKHYFRQSRFKVLVIDNVTDAVFQQTYELKTGKDLVSLRRMVVSNYGRVFLEAKTQFDPLHIDTRKKPVSSYYFFSLVKGDELQMINKTSLEGDNPIAHDPLIACLNIDSGELAISWDHYANEHSPILKSVSLAIYRGSLETASSRELIPDEKIMARAANYQSAKTGFENLCSQQIIPLTGEDFMLLMEQQRELTEKDKATQAPIKTIERNYILAYRLEGLQTKAVSFIDKRQTTHMLDYAFSIQALHQNKDVYLFYNEDCSADDEHGLYLMGTKLSATGAEPITQKIVHTSEDFFTSLQHIYPGAANRILFTEEKVVDFSVEGRELKLLEVKLK
jgi:hypothetical protein